MSSRAQQAVRLAQQHVPNWEIAQQLGLKERSVKTILSVARRRGVVVPYVGGPTTSNGYVVLRLSEAERDQLYAVAAERGVPPRELATQIVRNVVSDDLFAAVLDN